MGRSVVRPEVTVLVDAALRAGHTVAEAAALAGCSHDYARKRRQLLGLAPQPRAEPKAVEDRKDAVVRLAQEGHTSLQIGQQLGLGRERVRRIARERGVVVTADALVRKNSNNVRPVDVTKAVVDASVDIEALLADLPGMDLSRVDKDVLPEAMRAFERSRIILRELMRLLREERQRYVEAQQHGGPVDAASNVQGPHGPARADAGATGGHLPAPVSGGVGGEAGGRPRSGQTGADGREPSGWRVLGD